jgi:hypothetical protein
MFRQPGKRSLLAPNQAHTLIAAQVDLRSIQHKGSVMSRFISKLLTTIALCLSALTVVAQDALPYKDGVVVQVTAVRTQPGKFNEYVRYLTGPYSKTMDEAKKQGIVTNYSFFGAQPKSPDDPDLYIVETYPNMAVFDTITEKMTAISTKVWGSVKQSDEADANREEIRKILGSELLRELVPITKGSTE